MSMRKFTKLLMLFTLCLVGIQGNAQNVTIRGNNGSMIASVPNSGTEYDTFFKVGGFATWQHEQLSMVLTASDFTTLTSFGQLSNPANNLFSDGTHLQIGKGQGDYNKCYLSLSLPKGYRFTGYTIVFSKPGQTTKRLGSNTASFNTSNATSRFGETNSSFAFTNYKDVAINGSQTITRTSNSDTDMGNVLYFSLQNPDSRALITLESAEFYFTAEANYTPLTAVGSVNRMSAVDIPFKTSKVDYGPIQKNTYNGAERLSYRSSNVKDLQANLTLYEAGSTKPGTDFDGTTGQVIDYKVGSISVEDGYYRIGAADASKPGTEEHIYYIETPSSVLLSDNATKNPIGYRIVGAKIDYKYGQTNVYGTKTKTYPTFYFMFHVLLLGDYYLNANGGTTQTSGDRAEWFQDDEGYIRTGVNGYIYLTDKGSIMGGSRYPSTTTNKADAVKFNTIGNDGVVSYTENGNTYYLNQTSILIFLRFYRFQNNNGRVVSRILTGKSITVNIEDDVIDTHTEPYTLKVYDATGEVAQEVKVNSSNKSGSVYVNNMNNDALKIGVIGTGLIQGTLTLQALDPYLDQMKVVCTDPQVANAGGLRITQNFTASDFSVNGGEFHFSLPTECNNHTVKITFEDLLETNQVSEQAGRLLPTAIGYKGHAYALFDNKEYGLTYQEIEAYCVKMGGHLAVINNAEENFMVYMLTVRNKYQTAFFGYSDEAVEYRWEWVYGDSDYERWNQKSNQPDNGGVSDAGNENYAQFMAGAGDGTWDDARLDANTTCYICEWEENAAIPDHVDPPEANKTDPSGGSGTGKNPGPEPDPQENVPPQIFPDSSNTYLTDAQVNALSAEDVQKAINEIYARNGYRFKDPAWLAYYEQYDWYNGTIPSDQFDAAKEFNQIEFANVEKLRIRRDALKARGG